jgi:hypothetical protein
MFEGLLREVSPETLARHLGIASVQLVDRLQNEERTRAPLATLLAQTAQADGFDAEAHAGWLVMADRDRLGMVAAMVGAWRCRDLIRSLLAGPAVAMLVERLGHPAYGVAYAADLPAVPELSAAQVDMTDPVSLASLVRSEGERLLMSWLVTRVPGARALLRLRFQTSDVSSGAETELPDGMDAAMAWILRKLDAEGL